ncbi:MAG: DUF4105 domain-containing protein [Lentisphaeria bacterium]|nr:DUF4105 domain-containing protein [Lentisphaeria bacterium]
MKIKIRFNRILLHRLWVWVPTFAIVLAVGVWSVGAVRFAFHWPGAAVAAFAGVLLAFWIVALRRRPLLFIPAAIELVVIVTFAAMTPERMFAGTVWQAPWGRAPLVEYAGSRVTVRNVRDFHYRSVDDYDVRYTDFNFDPSTVRTIDVAISHWDGMQAIAHTMLSFGFEDGRYLAVSMETRLPEGVEQGFLPGFYHQYEILMVLATEEDLFKLRTDFRHEELYLYRTNATPEQARELLDYVMLRADGLSKHPEFYNSITSNCTTSLAPLLRVIDPTFEGDLRLLLNGYSDELLFELGYLKHHEGETFSELKKRRLAGRYVSLPSALPYSGLIRTDL